MSKHATFSETHIQVGEGGVMRAEGEGVESEVGPE